MEIAESIQEMYKIDPQEKEEPLDLETIVEEKNKSEIFLELGEIASELFDNSTSQAAALIAVSKKGSVSYEKLSDLGKALAIFNSPSIKGKITLRNLIEELLKKNGYKFKSNASNYRIYTDSSDTFVFAHADYKTIFAELKSPEDFDRFHDILEDNFEIEVDKKFFGVHQYSPLDINCGLYASSMMFYGFVPSVIYFAWNQYPNLFAHALASSAIISLSTYLFLKKGAELFENKIKPLIRKYEFKIAPFKSYSFGNDALLRAFPLEKNPIIE